MIRYLHCKCIQYNFYTFYVCPTFHCPVNYCSIQVQWKNVKTDLQCFTNSTLLHCNVFGKYCNFYIFLQVSQFPLYMFAVCDTLIMLIISMISTIKWVETWYRALKNEVWLTRFVATILLILLFIVHKELNAQILVCSTFTLSSLLRQWFGHFRDNVGVVYLLLQTFQPSKIFSEPKLKTDNNEVDPDKLCSKESISKCCNNLI